ncbi:MAG: hypothetical protein ACOY3P_25515 [Planctomycetota bacterium]
MPSIQIADWAMVRFETIGLAIFVILLANAFVRWMWSILAKDFERLPRLTYFRSLAGVLLVGLALIVVLTMIAGSRELLTPGAWEKSGLVYKVAGSPTAGPAADADARYSAEPPAVASIISAEATALVTEQTRRRGNMEVLRFALWQYATAHEGALPAADAVPAQLWEVPGTVGLRFIYRPGLSTTGPRRLVACEPEVDGIARFALYSDGEIVWTTSAVIRTEFERDAAQPQPSDDQHDAKHASGPGPAESAGHPAEGE